MDDHVTMSCRAVMVWLRVMSDGEAAKLVSPHLEECPTCRRGDHGLRRLAGWIACWRLESMPPGAITSAIAAWCAHSAARTS